MKKQFVILVTAKSGDRYAIGPFDTMVEAQKIAAKLEFVQDSEVIELTRDHMPTKHSFLPMIAHVLNASAYVLETQSDKPKSIAEIASILRDTADDVRKIAKD